MSIVMKDCPAIWVQNTATTLYIGVAATEATIVSIIFTNDDTSDHTIDLEYYDSSAVDTLPIGDKALTIPAGESVVFDIPIFVKATGDIVQATADTNDMVSAKANVYEKT
ncbi:MAG: hypothetical protein V1709_08650 [Planctomycetota bacterium]